MSQTLPAMPPLNEDDMKPKFMRSLIWDNAEHTSTSVITTSSEHLLLVPTPPENELTNVHALSTIRAHPELFKIVTPIRVKLFAQLLQHHPNQPLVTSVCRALREGFWPWAITGQPGYPTTYDNSQRGLSKNQRVFLREQRDEEIRLGQYSESFGTDLLPGMYSMPIGTAPKPQGFRLVNDFSAGQFSLNSMVLPSEVPVKVDGIRPLAAAIRRAHQENPSRKIVVFKSDVSRAYRLLPMHPLWQIRQIVTIDGQRHVDRCNCFGGRAGGRIWVTFLSLVLWIAQEVLGVKDLFGYIDDVFSWQYSDELSWYEPYQSYYPSKQTLLLLLWDLLGIPHKQSKQLFGVDLIIIGFRFNIVDMRITMPADAARDLLKRIASFIQAKRCKLHDLQRLAGWMNRALDVHPYLRPALTSLHEKMAGQENPHLNVCISKRIRRDLRWFSTSFTEGRDRGINFLTTIAWDAGSADVVLTADACLTGIGFFCPQLLRGYYCAAPRMQEIFHLEILAVACALRWSRHSFPAAKRILILSDNVNTVDAFCSLKASGFPNDILRYCCEEIIRGNLDIRVRHICTKDNWVSDDLSRGLFSRLGPARIRATQWQIPRDLRLLVRPKFLS